MLNKLQKLINSQDKKQILINFFSLTVLQLLTYALPLLTVPYLVKVIGVSNFGLVSFAMATITYFQIVVDFGFNYTATREISIYQNNKEKLTEIFSAVLTIKILLLIICGIILTLLIALVNRLQQDWNLFLVTYGIVIGNMLFPIWFFQGVEKMRYITFLNALSKTIFTIAIFIFIKSPNDYIFVPLFNAVGGVIVGIWSLILIKNKFKINFKIQPSNIIHHFFLGSWHLFISNFATSLYTTTTTVLLGFFTNNTITGYYAMADKLIAALKGLISPVSQALFPFINRIATNSRMRVKIILKRIMFIWGSIMLIITLLLFLFAKEIILTLFGNESINSISVLRILSIIPFLVAIDTILGTLNMLVYKKNREYSNIIISAGLLNLIVGVTLISLFNHIGAAIAVLSVEIFITVRLFIYTQNSELKLFNLNE